MVRTQRRDDVAPTVRVHVCSRSAEIARSRRFLPPTSRMLESSRKNYWNVKDQVEEKKGYLGWTGRQDKHDDGVTFATIKFAWADDKPGHVTIKPVSTILVGATPEFEVLRCRWRSCAASRRATTARSS